MNIKWHDRKMRMNYRGKCFESSRWSTIELYLSKRTRCSLNKNTFQISGENMRCYLFIFLDTWKKFTLFPWDRWSNLQILSLSLFTNFNGFHYIQHLQFKSFCSQRYWFTNFLTPLSLNKHRRKEEKLSVFSSICSQDLE